MSRRFIPSAHKSRIGRRHTVSQQEWDAVSTPPVGLLWLHLIILFLATVSDSVVHGWGLLALPDYSPIQLLVYLAAYVLGISPYGALRRRYTKPLGWIAAAGWILCIGGSLSVVVEFRYRLSNSHFYWPYATPLLSLLLGFIALVLLGFQKPRKYSPAARRR